VVRQRPSRLALGLAGALALAGCSPVYVLRAGYEEARILWRRQPIERVLQRSDLDRETRAKLELTLEVREFARDRLGLRVGGCFASLATVDADQVVHVVLAAERFRLEPVTWWFPVVGRVPYKGFFDEQRAQAAAARLEAEGFDTVVQPSVAFSTLGWFDDPLLSNLLRYDPVTLATVILHELTHTTRYLSGHGAFNESFANFVGYAGAREFFHESRRRAEALRAHDLWDDARAFSFFLADFTARLETAYAAGIDEAERTRMLDAGQEQFRGLTLRTGLNADFGAGRLNNARILHYRLYYDRLGLFDRLLQHHRGDMAAAIRAALEIADDATDPYAVLTTHLAATPAAAGLKPAPQRG
jgi:predicted aminopeptidase